MTNSLSLPVMWDFHYETGKDLGKAGLVSLVTRAGKQMETRGPGSAGSPGHPTTPPPAPPCTWGRAGSPGQPPPPPTPAPGAVQAALVSAPHLTPCHLPQRRQSWSAPLTTPSHPPQRRLPTKPRASHGQTGLCGWSGAQGTRTLHPTPFQFTSSAVETSP